MTLQLTLYWEVSCPEVFSLTIFCGFFPDRIERFLYQYNKQYEFLNIIFLRSVGQRQTCDYHNLNIF